MKAFLFLVLLAIFPINANSAEFSANPDSFIEESQKALIDAKTSKQFLQGLPVNLRKNYVLLARPEEDRDPNITIFSDDGRVILEFVHSDGSKKMNLVFIHTFDGKRLAWKHASIKFKEGAIPEIYKYKTITTTLDSFHPFIDDQRFKENPNGFSSPFQKPKSAGSTYLRKNMPTDSFARYLGKQGDTPLDKLNALVNKLEERTDKADGNVQPMTHDSPSKDK